jgi:hypothetical protein
MTGTKYEVVYVARSPASMQQDDFAAMVDELCNGRAGEGWSLVSTAGDYGANLTLGVWLYFAREGGSAPDESLVETGADEDVAPATDEDVAPAADEDVAPATGLDEDSGESPESAEAEESTEETSRWP